MLDRMMAPQTTEEELRNALQLMLMDRYGDIGLENDATVRGHESFAAAGVRYNEGLVLTLSDGAQFHLTINRSA